MQVTHAEVHRVTLPAPQPAFSWRKGLLGSGGDGDGAVLRLGTDEGVEGVALVGEQLSVRAGCKPNGRD